MRCFRFIYILLVICWLEPTAQAQNNESFFGFKSGASIPLGKYYSADLDGGSFAEVGYNITAEGAWFFNPNWGVGGQANIQQHPVDVGLLGWKKVLDDPFLSDLYIRSEPYLMLTAMAGVYYRRPVYKKFNAEMKLLGGMLYGKTPYQLYKPQYFLFGPEYYEITSAQDWNFAVNAGLGLQYNITPCYSFVLDSDFAYSNLAFSFVSSTGTRIDQRTIFFVNLSLGIRIRI